MTNLKLKIYNEVLQRAHMLSKTRAAPMDLVSELIDIFIVRWR